MSNRIRQCSRLLTSDFRIVQLWIANLTWEACYNIWTCNIRNIQKVEEASKYVPCQERLTTKHFFLNCYKLNQTWNKYYKSDTLKNLFKNINPKNIGLYKKILKNTLLI